MLTLALRVAMAFAVATHVFASYGHRSNDTGTSSTFAWMTDAPERSAKCWECLDGGGSGDLSASGLLQSIRSIAETETVRSQRKWERF